jgi:hypothetical protein
MAPLSLTVTYAMAVSTHPELPLFSLEDIHQQRQIQTIFQQILQTKEKVTLQLVFNLEVKPYVGVMLLVHLKSMSGSIT